MISCEIFTSEYGDRILVKTHRNYISAAQKLMIDKGYWVLRVIIPENDDVFILMIKNESQEVGEVQNG